MVNAINDPLSSYYHETTQKARQDDNDLKQEDFLRLLVTQINAQDPLDPQEGADFLAQLAQFGVVDGIQKMEQSFTNFTENFSQSQVLGATHLLEREVFAPTDRARVDEEPLQGRVVLNEPGRGAVGIYNEYGELIRSLELGNLKDGVNHFSWDLKDQDGEKVEPGIYSVRTSVTSSDNKETFSVQNFLSQKVKSLAVRQGEPVHLELENARSVKLDDIEYIG